MNTTMHSVGRVAIAVIIFSAFTASAALVSHWTGDNTFDDNVGSNDGAAGGGTTYDASGKIGQAWSLDGADDRVLVADDNTLDVGTTFTKHLWFKADAVSGASRALFLQGYDDAQGKNNYLQVHATSVLFYGVRISGSLTGTTTLSAGTWHHAVVTYDATTLTIYLDGALEISGATTIDMDGDSRVIFGRYERSSFTAGCCYYEGLIDDAALWDEALTADEVKVLHDVGDTLGYTADDYDDLKQVHDAGSGSVTIGGLEWTHSSSLSAAAGCSGSSPSYTVVFDDGPSSGSRSGLTSATAPPPFAAWDLKMKITFDGYNRSETLSNFPVLVELGTHLPGFSYGNFASGANADLRFADSTETVELSYQIDVWNTNGSSYVWVAVVAVTNESSLYAYWGKSGQTAPSYTTNGATFSNGYVGVWHLEESGDGTVDEFKDSTPIGNHGRGGGTHGASYVPTRVSPGKIAAANDFDVSGDWVDVADNASLDITDKITVSGWVYVENSKSGGKNQYMLDKQNHYGFVVRDDETVRFFGTALSPVTVTTVETLSLDTWHHIAATYDKDASGDNAKVFIDGRVSFQGGVSGAIGTDNTVLRLGTYANSGGTAASDNWTFDGNMDEVRLSDVARSTNWMFATYLNMASNAVFQTYGGAVGSAPTISTLDATNVASSSAFLNGDLISTGTSATALWVFYGTTDAMTNKSAWTTSVLLEANATTGNKTHLATGLSTSADYYYRYFASNSSAQAWGHTKSFRTQFDASQWSKDMKITFTGYDRGENLVNFPVLVVLSESGLTGFDYGDFLSPPHHDLRFTDESGTVELRYQIDDWDVTGSSYVWVAVDGLTNNGCIYAYWGNSGEIAPSYTTNGTTWSNGYVGVWHLEESGDGTVGEFKDSTPIGNHGRGGGTSGASYVPTRVSPGKIAAANDFDISGDWVDMADHASLDITDKITISGWVYIENSKPSGNHYLLDKQNRYALFVRPDETIWFYSTGPSPGSVQTTESLSLDTWHHIAATYDNVGEIVNVFIDGRVSVQASVSGPMAEDNTPLRLGTYANGGAAAASSIWTFDGNMDEVRLSDVARSTNWMFATWLNMASNDVFQTYGEVGAEFVPPGTMIIIR